jgi:hypothetical protein
LWVDATLEGKNAFGKTVRNGVTLLAVQRGNVIVESASISIDNEDAGDMPGAIALMNAALQHLKKLNR